MKQSSAFNKYIFILILFILKLLIFKKTNIILFYYN